MKIRPVRAYADTSVFGGIRDEEFAEVSKAFFEQVRRGHFQLVTSAVVQEEMQFAPQEVHNLFDEMLEMAEVIEITEDALRLQKSYLDAGILGERWATDALHVALATVSVCTLIVSWNFGHIVHFEKIPLYNAVNTLKGYSSISIHSPLEVVSYEEEV
jgi:hypothetical protein